MWHANVDITSHKYCLTAHTYSDIVKIMDISMIYYLVPTLVMFCCGIYGFITRKNMIAMLISIELMLNAVDINFVIFNRYLFPGQLEGMMFTLFAIAIAAAETALAIAIIINLYRAHKNIDVSDLTKMKF